MQGGITHGQYTVCRSAVSPHGVPGFAELASRRVSGTRPALRGRVPSPYGGVAPRGDTPNCAPVERVPALLPPDPRRSAFVYAGLCEDLRTARGPGTLIRHGPEHSASLDACPPAWAAGGPAHPGRCPTRSVAARAPRLGVSEADATPVVTPLIEAPASPLWLMTGRHGA